MAGAQLQLKLGLKLGLCVLILQPDLPVINVLSPSNHKINCAEFEITLSHLRMPNLRQGSESNCFNAHFTKSLQVLEHL